MSGAGLFLERALPINSQDSSEIQIYPFALSSRFPINFFSWWKLLMYLHRPTLSQCIYMNKSFHCFVNFWREIVTAGLSYYETQPWTGWHWFNCTVPSGYYYSVETKKKIYSHCVVMVKLTLRIVISFSSPFLAEKAGEWAEYNWR